MLVATSPGFFVAGKVDQSTAATDSVTADTSVQLSAAAARHAGADIATARAYLDSALDTLVADAASGGQRDGQGDGSLKKIVARASAHWVEPRMRPLLHAKAI